MLNLLYSQNFWWAIIARFLWGFLNGNVGVVKTYLSEVNCDVIFLYYCVCHQICDDTNQAQGFSIMGTTGGIGLLSVRI